MLSWYKSWFCKSGTLDLKGYVRHIVAALAFFFGFAFLGLGLFFLLLRTMIALHLPTWVAWLPILSWLTIGTLAIGSFKNAPHPAQLRSPMAIAIASSSSRRSVLDSIFV